MVVKAAEQATSALIQGGMRQFLLPIAVAILSLWFIYQNWDTISTASRKLVTVDENAKSIASIRDSIDAIELKIINIEDFEGDMTGTVERLTESVRENTDWRIGQEKRATTRIAEQGFREQRLQKLEAEFEAWENRRIKELEDRIKKLENGQ